MADQQNPYFLEISTDTTASAGMFAYCSVLTKYQKYWTLHSSCVSQRFPGCPGHKVLQPDAVGLHESCYPYEVALMADHNETQLCHLQVRGSGLCIVLRKKQLDRLGWRRNEALRVDVISGCLVVSKISLPKIPDIAAVTEKQAS